MEAVPRIVPTTAGNLQGLVTSHRHSTGSSPALDGALRSGLSAESSSLTVPFLPGLERHEDYDEDDESDEDYSDGGDVFEDEEKEFDVDDWMAVEEYVDEDGDLPRCPCAAWYYAAMAMGHLALGLLELATVLHTPAAEQREQLPGRVCVLVVLGALAYDNVVVALGRHIGVGDGWCSLRALSQGRGLLRSGCVPLLLVYTVGLGQQAEVKFLCGGQTVAAGNASSGDPADDADGVTLDAPQLVVCACLVLVVTGLLLKLCYPRLELRPVAGPGPQTINRVLEYSPEGYRHPERTQTADAVDRHDQCCCLRCCSACCTHASSLHACSRPGL